MKKSIVYTRTGDLGTTGLVGGERVKKSSLRVDTYGTVDELNSCIGVVASMSDITQDIRTELQWIQNKLFNLGSYLATNPGDEMTPSRVSSMKSTGWTSLCRPLPGLCCLEAAPRQLMPTWPDQCAVAPNDA